MERCCAVVQNTPGQAKKLAPGWLPDDAQPDEIRWGLAHLHPHTLRTEDALRTTAEASAARPSVDETWRM